MADRVASQLARFLAAALLLVLLPAADARADLDPDYPFTPWDGEWSGMFIVYRTDGTRLETIEVTHRYQRAGSRRQVGEFENRYANGRVERETAVNSVGEYGRITCEVRRADGTTVVHSGRIDGDAIIWHREDAGTMEIFHERVIEDTYRISGMGIYGPARQSRLLFVGEYHRQP
jgi:hypothetical protein